MKCKICGAELKKDGDICTKCYNKIKKEEELKTDTNELYKLKRSYVPGFEIIRMGDFLILALIILLAVLASKQYLACIILLVIFIAIAYLVIKQQKKKAEKTTCTFYEKKIVYNSNSKEKVIEYKNVKDIGFYQTFSQKLFNIGDIRIYPEGGVLITSAINMENVKNVKEEYEKMSEVVKKQMKIGVVKN
jgi:positive regulator of sigma E activity